MRRWLIVLLLVSGGARAEFNSGNQLYGEMLSREPVARASAQGYLMGAFDATQHAQHCAPGTVTLRQVWDIALRMLKAVPAQRHEPANLILLAAFRAVWPCAPRGNGA